MSIRPILGLILAAGFAAAVVAGRYRPYTMDEYFTMLEGIGQVPFGTGWATATSVASRDVWARADWRGVHAAVLAGDNGNMSLYTFAIHALIDGFGTGSGLVLSAVSVAGYLLSIYGSYRVGRRLFGERVGLISAVLCLCHFGMMVNATFLRSYSLGMALGLFATASFLSIVGIGRNDDETGQAPPFFEDVLPYAAWTLAALFAHFLSAVIIFGHVVYALAAVRDRRTWARLACAGGLVVAVFVPVYVMALSGDGYAVVADYIAYRESTKDIPRRSPAEMARSLALAAQFMSGLHAELPPLLVLPAAVCVVALAGPESRRWMVRNRRRVGLVALLASVSLASASARLAMADSLFPVRPRYTLMSAPWFAILMACLLDRIVRTGGNRLADEAGKVVAAAYVVVAGAVPFVVLAAAVSMDRGNAYRSAAERIAATGETDAIRSIGVPTLFDAQMIAFYLGPGGSVVFEIEDRAMAAQVRDTIRTIGLSHPVVTYYEFWDAYEAKGQTFRDLQPATAAPGTLRFRYGESGLVRSW